MDTDEQELGSERIVESGKRQSHDMLFPLVEKTFPGGLVELTLPSTTSHWLLSILFALVCLLSYASHTLGVPSWWCAITSIVASVFLCSKVVEESVLVIPRVGIQLNSVRGLRFSSKWLLITGTTKTFLPRDTVLDLFTKEAIYRWGIVDYLAVAVRQKDSLLGSKEAQTGNQNKPVITSKELFILFPSALPKLHIVKHVYRTIYPVLFVDAARPVRGNP